MKFKTTSLALASILLAALPVRAAIRDDLPKGLMLNMDFETAREGLIPSKALYPLHVPMGELGLEWFHGRNMLAVQPEQGLDIPHSSMLEPNGDEWVVTLRAICLTDGLIVSQANGTHGFAIYMKDGHISARVKTGATSFLMQENERYGRKKVINRWVTIELRIRENMAILYLNRERVAMVMDQPALSGDNQRIRIGEHRALPAPLARTTDQTPTGFTGAINSFKILRQ